MKSLVYTAPETLVFRDSPMPSLLEGDALINIAAVGICGSDMHAFLGHDERRPAPLILGHEAAGTIIEGPGKGKRVTINPLVSCGKCDACKTGRKNLCPDRQIISLPPREGAFAQYVAMPTDNLVEIPHDTSFEKAALAEPLACGWHAVRLAQDALHGNLAETRCVVIGGGAIGLGAALCLKAFGASDIYIAETNHLRHKTLKSSGEFNVYDPLSKSNSNPENVDLVIDAVGYASTRKMASAIVNPGGVIAHIGLGDGEGGLDIRRMTLQEITFFGTYTYTPDDFRDTAHAIFEGRLGSLDWIEERPLSEGQNAFEEIRAGKVNAPKIILHP